MKESFIGEISALKFENLENFSEINHFITTRKYPDENNLNANELLEKISHTLEYEGIASHFLYQIHGDNVIVVDDPNNYKNNETGDAIITNHPGLCIMVKTADCIPVILYDHVNKIIGVVHAGWRGSLKEVGMKTVYKMIEKFKSDPTNIIAGIGPGIGPNVYEVGKSVFNSFVSENKIYKDFFTKISAEKYFLDLWNVNKNQLLQAGIPEKNIDVSEICNYSNPKLFYSARKEGVRTGRMFCGIYLK